MDTYQQESQKNVVELVGRLPAVVNGKNQGKIIDWISAYAKASDCKGIDRKCQEITKIFVAGGYLPVREGLQGANPSKEELGLNIIRQFVTTVEAGSTVPRIADFDIRCYKKMGRIAFPTLGRR